MKFHTPTHRSALAAISLSTMLAMPAVGQVLNEDAKLLPTDGAATNNFGFSVALSGTTALTGAPFDDDNGALSGSAYLFDTTTGQQIAKLLPEDGAVADYFGYAIAVSGTTALVGAWSGSGSGSAYLFDTTTGQQIAKLLPADGAAGDDFGFSVAISGSTALVGAPGDDDNGSQSGSAYLFDTTTGQQLAKLLPADGAANDDFGSSVALSGTTALVGAFLDDDNGDRSGSAYLFDTTAGQQIAKLLPADGAALKFFGFSVAISGTTTLVGAPGDDDNGTDSGSAYLFDTTTGQQLAKLLPTDGAVGDEFGLSVAISGTTAMIGAQSDDDNGASSGSAYLFDTTTGQQIAKLLPADGAESDRFGSSVAISGSTALVAAPLDDDNGSGSGSAYLFAIPDCIPDLTGDGTLDFFDLSAFLTALANQDPFADFNTDGSFDFFDLSAYLDDFAAGCP